MLTNIQVDVVKWGNSNAVRLPAAMLKIVNIGLGDRLNLNIKDGCLVLERAQPAYELEAMLARVTKDNLHEAVTVGEPQGREGW